MKADFCGVILVTAAMVASAAVAAGAIHEYQQSENCEIFSRSATCLPRAAEVAPAAPPSEPLSGWRLVKSKDPNGGADAVAIMHTADISKSDIGLAGLMVRCHEKGVEVLVITTIPFAPRARPHIKLRVDKAEEHFDAAVVPPFSALLLPNETVELVYGKWQNASELSVQIEEEQTTVRGVVALGGLGAALANLRANCPST
jgi:hypothetical protein